MLGPWRMVFTKEQSLTRFDLDLGPCHAICFSRFIVVLYLGTGLLKVNTFLIGKECLLTAAGC